MSEIYEITEQECYTIECWIKSSDCPENFDSNTIEGILNHWRREQMKFTESQETALINVYNGYKLYKKTK